MPEKIIISIYPQERLRMFLADSMRMLSTIPLSCICGNAIGEIFLCGKTFYSWPSVGIASSYRVLSQEVRDKRSKGTDK